MKKLSLLALFLLVLLSCNSTVKDNPKENSEDFVKTIDSESNSNDSTKKILSTTEAIAQANGFNNWKNVKEIQFTFNVDRDSSHYDRTWKWRPKENLVTLLSTKDTVEYNRTQMDSTALKVDPGFINDKYWLLAPYNLIWDADSFTSTLQVNQIAPISKSKMQKLTIVYKNEGGYTPGDAYDFYFQGDFIIKEWAFRKGNAPESSLITTWEDYKDFNGIKIAKTHNRNEGNWKLHFTGINVLTE
ncbi:hypothetical protein [Aquimarina sp. 2201CG5-10]|uniref:hypothetical protein n=1 Tax=Aquimarina callyspongiae TaxID=3098150 RepID=UPI002AB54FB4|nr:hypothetical protein [Aquimarina sp. 2201CG5-10]MDY8138605.1 hypothetical protein [Aquimarina sp. 2201CG5-10]